MTGQTPVPLKKRLHTKEEAGNDFGKRSGLLTSDQGSLAIIESEGLPFVLGVYYSGHYYFVAIQNVNAMKQ